jgi:plastocyanin
MRYLIMPMLTLALFAGPAAIAQPSGQAAEPVTVTLSNFKFTPDPLNLRAGQSYRIHFTNSSTGGHNFVAKEFFAASDVAAADRAKVAKGAIDLGSGESVDVTLTPTKPGTYASHCSHFMHASFGMKGTIIVQ